MSEWETLIPKKNFTEICFDNKMANNGGKYFILTANFYTSAKDTALLDPKKRKPEGKSDVHMEGTEAKNQK